MPCHTARGGPNPDERACARPRALSSMHLDLKSYLSQRFGHKTLCRRDLHYIDLFAYSGRSVTYDIRLPKPVARAAAERQLHAPQCRGTLQRWTSRPTSLCAPPHRTCVGDDCLASHLTRPSGLDVRKTQLAVHDVEKSDSLKARGVELLRQ